MNVQLLSDIYIGLDGSPFLFDFPACAPNLALLGDIVSSADPRLFGWLDFQLSRFERVFFVLGAQEAYYSSLSETVSAFEAFEARVSSMRATGESKGEFIFLNRRRYDIGSDLTILGCTLWSSLDPGRLNLLSQSVIAFRLIHNFKPFDYHASHLTDLTWLSDTIENIRKENNTRRVVVFTHHAPTIARTSDPSLLGSYVDCVFATELTKLPLWGSPVTVWACGHTHWSCDFQKEGVRVVSNQRGYGREPTKSIFDEKKVISV